MAQSQKITKALSNISLKLSETCFTDIPLPNFEYFDEPEKDPKKIGKLENEINPSKLAEYIDQDGQPMFERIIILDCRFEYEYKGGHIKDAINITTYDELLKIYDENKENGEKTCVVFYCDFGCNRSRIEYSAFREHDRNNNIYPKLCFPNIFVLEGGYKRFFTEMSERCTGGYVSMRDEKYIINGDLRKCQRKFRIEHAYRPQLRNAESLRRPRRFNWINSSLTLQGKKGEIIITDFDDDNDNEFITNYINEKINKFDNDVNTHVLDRANDLINFIRSKAKEEIPDDCINDASALLQELKDEGWWGPYSVITYLLKYESDTKLTFDILPIDFNSGYNFTDPINLQYIESLLSQGRSYILLWSYVYFFHNELKELADKYITPSGSKYKDVFEKIIRKKFKKTDNLFIDASRSFGELIASHFSAIKNTPNPDQILEAENCSFIESDQVNRFIAPEQFWLNDKGCAFVDNYKNMSEIPDKFPEECFKEPCRFETDSSATVDLVPKPGWKKKGPAMSRIARIDGKEYNKGNKERKARISGVNH